MNKTNSSDITVGIPFYRQTIPSELIDSITSILNQSCPADEIHLIQDGPVDKGLQKVVDKYKNQSNIKLIILNKVGLPMALNTSIKMTKTRYYARMDSDDIAHPDRFKKQINFLNNNTEQQILGSWAYEFKENIENEDMFLKKMPIKNSEIKNYFHYRNPFIHSSIIFRMSLFDEVGYYNVNYLTGQDLNLWSRVLKNNIKVSNFPEPLVYFRIKNKIMIKRRSSINSIWNECRSKYNYNTVSIKYNLLKICSIFFRFLPYKIKEWLYLNTR
tara:strand:- start:288 stop:1103 length:816 start_codon:yes stop_codon:yes gene_type:complete